MATVWIVKPTKKKDFFTGFKFDKNLKSYQFFPEIELSQLQNQRVYLVLEPSLFHLEVSEIPGKIPAFIQAQAESKVREVGLFLTSPKVIFKILETFENSSKVFIFGIEEKLISSYAEIFRKNQVRIEVVTHKLLSVFSLLKKMISKEEVLFPVLAVIAEPIGIWYLVTSEKVPLYAKFSAVDELLGISSQTFIEDILTLRDYTYRFLGEELRTLIILGEEREKLLSENLQEVLKINLIDFKTEEKMRYPEIFGTIYLEEVFNFLPPLEKLFFKHLHLIENLIPFLAIFTSLSLTLNFFLYYKNLEMERKIYTELSNLKSLTEGVSQEFSEDVLKKIKTYIDLEKQKRKLLRVDELLVWLSQNWDRDFIFKDLNIVPKDNETYSISIKLEIKGNFTDTQTKIDKFIKEINQRYKLHKSNLEFLEKERKAILDLEFLSKK